MLKVNALELWSVICEGRSGLRDEPKHVTTRATSGNCVGWPPCWQAPRYIVEPVEKVMMGGVVAGLLYEVSLCVHCIKVTFRLEEGNV